MDILILSTQSGDWEGMYVDGILHDQGHVLGEGKAKSYLLEKSEELGFKFADVRTETLSDEDDEEVSDFGCLPSRLSILEGNYYKKEEVK